MPSQYNNVDEYIACYDDNKASVLHKIRSYILKIDSRIQERIWYNVPHYYYVDTKIKPLVGYSVAKHHITIGFTKVLEGTDYERILHNNGYKTGKYTIQIQHNQDIPYAILEDIIKDMMNG